MSKIAWLVLWFTLPVASTPVQNPLDVDPADVRSGLAAVYRSLRDPAATLHRIEAKPGFTLGRSSPHPRIPAGPFEVTWTGILLLQDTGPVSFEARLGGELAVEIDGVTVLAGRGSEETSRLGPKAALDREPGAYRCTIRYRSLPEVPARLQLFWQAPSFALEPLPAWRLVHRVADLPAPFASDDLIERGRVAAGRLGCARCHASALPGIDDPPPGPSLAGAPRRLRRDWVLRWLEDPARMYSEARMPVLFPPTREGFVERWILAEALSGAESAQGRKPPAGDHRAGRLAFLSVGCVACHLVPDLDRAEQPDLDRTALAGLGERFGSEDLAAFLANPHSRYPDGRMPRVPLSDGTARDLAAYLSRDATTASPAIEPPAADEVRTVERRLGVAGQRAAADALVREKGCTSCHTGLGDSSPQARALAARGDRGCLSPAGLPHYAVVPETRKALAAYLDVALREAPPSPFVTRQRQLARAGCVRCHQRDSDRPAPLEAAASTLGGAFLQVLPFQRTPRLTNPHRRFTRRHLLATLREGVSGLRGPESTYRMPSFGPEAETLLQALAEGDGELPDEPNAPEPPLTDPTLGTLAGPVLVGSQGYSCISCHLWNGRQLAQPDPGAVGPDLTRVVGRIRRDWFDRFVEGPLRLCPGTPMPTIFERGKPAQLASVLDGDPAKQKDALWSYFARGKEAPSPKPPESLPIAAQEDEDYPLVAQVPVRLPDNEVVESLCVLDHEDTLLIYDLAAWAPRAVYTGARLLRNVQGRTRQFLASGTPEPVRWATGPALELVVEGRHEAPLERTLLGYDALEDGVRIRSRARFHAGVVEVVETLRFEGERSMFRRLRFAEVPPHARLVVGLDQPIEVFPSEAYHTAYAAVRVEVRPKPAPAWEGHPVIDAGRVEGSPDRPGYRAIAYPRPKLVSGEDRVMPVALAVRPRDGQVFVASWKTGEILALHDAEGDGRSAYFKDYGRGPFQDAFAMLAEGDDLYILHRRNLTRVIDLDDDPDVADRFDRIAELPHGVADTYDYAYGLVRDRSGAFILSFAPHANRHLSGSGGALRLVPGEPPREVAYGFRNPLGWCTGPEGEVFFTDNQGEWVATNKLCHLDEGRFHGFPNAAQRQHASKPMAKPAVWVPYGWARSINGVTYDTSGGRFGPFAGQFFLAELMFGGAIIRADVEKVNGQYQGACFPFWGKGLLGPVSLAFDPRGHLYVGGITEPGWMAQPDRGALFRIDFTGKVPFEMQTIRARPRGFRAIFTKPVDRASASRAESYQLEHYRYEYTGAYGSPELDRTRDPIEAIEVSADGRTVDMRLRELVPDRVYLLTVRGVRSEGGEALVYSQGAYTLNELP
jgi:mono/diheme cytochrome c family protein/glucose/arabinose dehydrogenase